MRESFETDARAAWLGLPPKQWSSSANFGAFTYEDR